MASNIRPTKKQRELLDFIGRFIQEHGYSPSYREIMNGLSYTSVATVAVHVNNLISRGHLRKRDRSARSLEVVDHPVEEYKPTNAVAENDAKWLVRRIEAHFAEVETAKAPDQESVDQLFVLVGALKILDMDGAVNSFIPRLSELKRKIGAETKAG